MNKILTLGPKFSYSYNLSKEVFGSDEIICKSTIEEVFVEVSKNESIVGIVPIENLINGSVRETFMCLQKYNVKICKAFDYGIHHSFASLGEKFTKILSHPQAIAQSSEFLKKYREKGIEVSEISSTSKALEIAGVDKSVAAIGSKIGAENYGLNILAENIENNSNNVTRFIEIRKDCERISGEKTSMIIEPKFDKPGLLYEILAVFKIKDINLTKIESLPTGEKIGEYIFYLDVDGSLEDDNLKDAIKFLETFVNVNLFGSYSVEKR